MENIKEYLIDFVEGRITVPEFIEYTKKHREVLEYLTKISDSKFRTVVVHRSIDENGNPLYVPEELPFNAELFLEEQLSRKGGKTGKYLNIHGLFSNVLKTAFPNEQLIEDQTLDNKYTFLLKACPMYIGGEEVDELLESVLELIPETISKSERIKLYKEQVKTLFHIEKNKFPRWVQAAEWPLGEDGIPMRFVSQRGKKGKAYETMLYTEYLFEDVKTGARRIVTQFT